MTERLHAAVAAVCPIDGVSGGPPPAAVRVDYRAAATQPQRDAAAAAVAAFDWSQAAHDAWLLARRRAAAEALLSAQEYAANLIRAVVLLTVDELNALRGVTVGVAAAAWDPASIANGAGLTSPNVTVAGAAFGDVVDVLPPYSLQGLVCTGYVSAANTVVVRLHNGTGAAVNLPSGTWGVCVRRPVATPPRTPAQARAAVLTQITSGAADS